MIFGFLKNLFKNNQCDNGKTYWDSDGISAQRKRYSVANICNKQLKEVERLADMPFGSIKFIYRSADDKYDPLSKDIVDIKYDLQHNGYIAMPF